MLLRNPRLLAFLMIAIGTGLASWYGEQRWSMPPWSEAEIDQSVELNLALELQHRGPLLQPSGERLEQLRAMVRAEVEGQIKRERSDVERWIGLGLLLVVAGLAQWLLTLARPVRRAD